LESGARFFDGRMIELPETDKLFNAAGTRKRGKAFLDK
jgi:hypothetical protein